MRIPIIEDDAATRVLLTATARGEGTSVRVRLPASARAIRADEALVAPEADRAAVRVLLVDDEEAVRGLARRVLERSGYDVVEAVSGEAALQVLADRSVSIGVVVLDLNMPGLGGEWTLCQIRASTPQLPVIVSSGYPPQDEGALAGVPVLAKPYRPSELVDAVKAAIERAQPL